MEDQICCSNMSKSKHLLVEEKVGKEIDYINIIHNFFESNHVFLHWCDSTFMENVKIIFWEIVWLRVLCTEITFEIIHSHLVVKYLGTVLWS